MADLWSVAVLAIVARAAIGLALGEAGGGWALQRRPMGACEGPHDLRQRAKVEVDQAADGMMVEEPIAFGGEGAEARGALELLEAGDEPPTAAAVPADHGAPGAEPGVVQ